MEQLLALIADHGLAVYGFLFLYCALKSGLLPLVAGWAAQADVLNVWAVAAAVFLGGYVGDEIRFLAARRFGPGLRAWRPTFARMLDRAGMLFSRHGAAYMFLYRYPKGLRTVGALPVGFSSIAWRRFTILNALSAAVWAGLLVGVGYSFGAAIAGAAAESWGSMSLGLLAAMTVAGVVLWRRAGRPGVAAEDMTNSGSIGTTKALRRSMVARP
jgi:membrane protein DedA with SNARE-associated domain